MTSLIAARLGHEFANPALLKTALTHRSAATGTASNERLEFLGDRVLGLCIAEWLGERYPDEREGDLGKRLAALVAREALAPIAEAMGLAQAVRVPPAESRSGLRERANVLADALEALLGALFLDGGLPAARAVIRREWAALMEATGAVVMATNWSVPSAFS
jgi:ribonuclease-3